MVALVISLNMSFKNASIGMNSKMKCTTNTVKTVAISGYEEILSRVAIAGGFDVNFLYKVIYIESRHIYNIENKVTGAYGLIQVMPKYVNNYGLRSMNELKKMTRWEQVKLVILPHYSKYNGKIKNLADCYLAIFYPAAVGKSNSYKIGGNLVAQQNSGFDLNKDNQITKGEVVEYLNKFNFPTNKKEFLKI
jgi:hypothetical protein